jgi:serine protease
MHVLCFALALILSSSAATQSAPEAAARAPLGVKPARTELAPDHTAGLVELKFQHGSDVRLVAAPDQPGAFRLAGPPPEVEAVDLYLQSLGATPKRIFLQTDDWLVAWRQAGERRSGRVLHDLTQFYQVELPAHVAVGEVCDVLNSFAVIELAYPLGGVSDPTTVAVAQPGAAPDFEAQQGYRRPAPLGIDADYGRTFGGASGVGTRIVDVETGWTDDHEDVAHAAQGQYVGFAPQHYPWDHGTAVLGELVGENNGSGVHGLVPEAEIRLSTHQGVTGQIPASVANAAAAASPGDFVVLEVQCSGSVPGPFPCEYVASTFATVETATANGIHVFAAAGNGARNLDSSTYGGLFDRSVRDSGAVLVGASNGSSLTPASFSNFGTRLDAHGWGLNVTSCGYGDLFGAPNVREEYTAVFSGTSSATPIVTGAGVMLNGIHRETYGSDMDPLALRNVLTLTGTPQTSGVYIGPRPNVRAAIAVLGVPRIRIDGNLVPGGTFSVTQSGTPGDLFFVVFSPVLAPTPLYVPPYSYMFLGNPFRRTHSGTIGGNGEATYMATLPNDPALSGTTYGYFQGWARFTTGPGVGSFANYAPLNVL